VAATSEESRYLTEASTFLIERGFCGLVWLDEDLVVRDRSGSLVEFVPVGQPVAQALLPLFGCEDDIRALRSHSPKPVELANVKIVSASRTTPRLNIYVHWLDMSARYLIIVIRTTTQAGIEAELENQSRRRALAEAKTIEQARELERANAELTRVNRELDEFANIISHDLKSPMRALRYLVEDIDGAIRRLDDKAAYRHLTDLKQQSRRMSRMLTDLLTYTRIGPNSQEAIEEIDTRELLEAIIASLPRPRGFTLEIAGDWPAMRTVSAPLDLVVRNLIDNAIKHHDRPDGRIVVTASRAEGGLEIEIADDGPGIDPKYHEAVFQPFRKLEQRTPAGELSSGIGLSLVRKTVTTAGGHLALHSDPAVRRGTTFRLRWPGEIL
jgi:hypothetical protein